MAIRDALLAILAQGPCYGNQLKHEYDRRTGGAWPLNVGQIYTTLDRLERDNLVSAAAPNDQGQRVYDLTEQGRTEAAQWFARPLDDAPARDELATKIALAVTLADVDAIDVIERQRLSTQHRLAALRARRATLEAGDELASQLIVEAQIGAVTAEALWLDLAEQRMRQSSPASGVIPLETEPPRRGRPPQH
ncbi:DNA-binding PadR family transcriptional regulator [Glaciihabitans tibetensis]|uniref:DNA-binding PadR family transcriptional regulator n=1 Tax=Glaciihabitans tibetensis TaxID=1266600 RepID=A0A2T0VJ77_9MICO|nr:PadR family transcriptional regulator [Glaciihabitans tibetensis]PRY70281.1 DNA-binding PadR family transcriptional regulator [Glaciihabitans tibetensis]